MSDEANQRLNEVDSQIAKLKVEMTKALRWAEESRADIPKVGTRSLIFMGIAVILSIGAAGVAVASIVRKPVVSTESLHATKLEIRDAQGKPRMVAEGTSIRILDVEGKPKMIFELTPEGEMRLVMGPDRVEIRVDRHGQPILNLCDVMGRPRIGMSVQKERAEPAIILRNDRGDKVLGGP